jgi:hypothetical protein
MVVDRAALASLPAENQNLKITALEDQVSRVMVVRKLNVGRDLVRIGFETLNQLAQIWKLQTLRRMFQFLYRSSEVHNSKVRSTRWRIKA